MNIKEKASAKIIPTEVQALLQKSSLKVHSKATTSVKVASKVKSSSRVRVKTGKGAPKAATIPAECHDAYTTPNDPLTVTGAVFKDFTTTHNGAGIDTEKCIHNTQMTQDCKNDENCTGLKNFMATMICQESDWNKIAKVDMDSPPHSPELTTSVPSEPKLTVEYDHADIGDTGTFTIRQTTPNFVYVIILKTSNSFAIYPFCATSDLITGTWNTIGTEITANGFGKSLSHLTAYKGCACTTGGVTNPPTTPCFETYPPLWDSSSHDPLNKKGTTCHVSNTSFVGRGFNSEGKEFNWCSGYTPGNDKETNVEKNPWDAIAQLQYTLSSETGNNVPETCDKSGGWVKHICLGDGVLDGNNCQITVNTGNKSGTWSCSGPITTQDIFFTVKAGNGYCGYYSDSKADIGNPIVTNGGIWDTLCATAPNGFPMEMSHVCIWTRDPNAPPHVWDDPPAPEPDCSQCPCEPVY